MQNLYVVTHAQATHHLDKTVGGWHDTHLTEKGRAQAVRLAEHLYDLIQIPSIPLYSSDLKRTVQTAEPISAKFNSPVILDERLREFNYGEAGGKTREWRDRHIIPKPVDGNKLDHRVFTDSETKREIGTRITESINEIAATKAENIIIVTHGMASTYIIMAWLKVPVEYMDNCHFQAAPAAITHLREEETFGDRTVVSVFSQLP